MKLTLLRKKNEVEGVTSFIFQPSEKISWLPGQFSHYVLHHEPTDDRGSDRWFTISSAPFEGTINVTTRFTSDTGSSFKKALGNLKEGKTIEISLVEGDFTLEDSAKEYVFIAGGIGITPFHSMLKQLDYEKKPINVTLLYANRNQDITFKEELEMIKKNNPQFTIHYIISPEHIDEEKIKLLIPKYQKKMFYVSGPEPMVESMISMVKNMGITDEDIKGDWFPGYSAE